MVADNEAPSSPTATAQPARPQPPTDENRRMPPPHPAMMKPQVDITTAFKDGVSLNNTNKPEVLLNYVDLCAKMMYVGPRGPLAAITESEYEVKRYYTTKCIDVVFNGGYDYSPPEPVYVDPPKAEEPSNGEQEGEENEGEVKEEEKQEVTEQKEKEEEQEKEDVQEKEEERGEVNEDKGEDKEEEKGEAKAKYISMQTYQPRVWRLPENSTLTFKVPVAYQESEDGSQAIPVLEPVEPNSKTANVKVVVKTAEDLTEQDKLFLKNRFLAGIHTMYRRYVEQSARFEGMCHRGRELVRKMTTRKARRCFKTTIDYSIEGSTTLELVPNPKGEKDLKNINMWYQEFNDLYLERARTLKIILDIVAETRRFQENPQWKLIVGDPVFDWQKRLEKFILAPGNDELLSFIHNNEIKLESANEQEEQDPIKDALMFHFFNVSPKIIVQLAIAKISQEGLFGNDATLKKEADAVTE